MNAHEVLHLTTSCHQRLAIRQFNICITYLRQSYHTICLSFSVSFVSANMSGPLHFRLKNSASCSSPSNSFVGIRNLNALSPVVVALGVFSPSTTFLKTECTPSPATTRSAKCTLPSANVILPPCAFASTTFELSLRSTFLAFSASSVDARRSNSLCKSTR